MARILIADDHDAVREGMAISLSRLGHDVLAVKGGAEAIAAYRKKPADVVVTDLRMIPVDGIQVVRNTKLLSAEKGFISKDGVNTYEVTLELLNPRGATLDARVIDQIPLKGDKHVEVKLDKMEPWAIHDEHEGTLEWHVQLAAKQKKVITFQYTLTYPKGAKLRQW